MPEKDILEKTLEAYNDVFSDICNGLLFQGRPVITDDALTDAQPFSYYKTDGRLRTQERDVSKYWKRLTFRIALFGFENQTQVFRYMPLRIISYDGAAYRLQLTEDADPKYPVVTLVLYFGNEHWTSRNLLDCIEVPEELKPFVSDYHINVFEIAYLSEAQINCFHSDFRVLADYFVHRRTDPDYIPTDPQRFRHANEVLELMSVLTGDHRFEEMIDSEGGTPNNMCEVLDRAEARGEIRGRTAGILIGEERGIKRGRSEGRAEGRAEGRLEAKRELALNLRDSLGMKDPAEVAKLVQVEVELIERWFADKA